MTPAGWSADLDAGKEVECVSTDPGMVIAGYMKKAPRCGE